MSDFDTPRAPYPATTVGALVTTGAIILGLLASTVAAYELGKADARLDAPIECGDPAHPDGLHRPAVRR